MFSTNSSQVSVPLSAGAYIEDVFSTYLYSGNGQNKVIPTGLRLGAGATSAGWMSTFSTTDANPSINGTSVAADASGNIYVCGYASSGSFQYLILVKYNSLHVIQWQHKLSGSADLFGTSVAVDSSNNVYVCGYSDVYLVVAKYDSTGTLQWQRLFGGTVQGNSVAVDASGNVYVAGTSSTNSSIIVAKYNTSGTLQWQRSLNSAASDEVNSVAVDTAGNVYITGQSGTYGPGTYNIILVKYDTSGTLQWQRSFSSTGTVNDYAKAMVVDSSGNAYIAGNSDSTFGFVIAKYNTSGTLQWQRSFSAGNSCVASSIAIDGSGNIYVAGTTNAVSNGGTIAKYNNSGVLQWQRGINGTNLLFFIRSLAIDSSGNLCVCISDYNSGYLFLAKLPSDGSGTGTCTVGSRSFSYQVTSQTDAAGALVDSAGSLTGTTPTITDSAASFTDAALSSNYAATDLPVNLTDYGGMVWIKQRSAVNDHAIYDTARGATFDIVPNLTTSQTTQTNGVIALNYNDINIGSLAKINTNAATYASWTFRKQAKFFDVVTYTGTGSATTIAHNLGSVPGCIIVRGTSAGTAGYNWRVYHRSLTSAAYTVQLNQTNAESSQPSIWNSTAPTSTVFSVGTDGSVNGSGETYVAYLFAHNAGGFGAAGTDNVISCGVAQTTSTDAVVNLGWEPQLVLYKASSTAGAWRMFDNIRGIPNGSNDAQLIPNSSNAEDVSFDFMQLSATGFTINVAAENPNQNYIYIAIRRGPMKTPTVGTSVFALYNFSYFGGQFVQTNFVTDLIIGNNRSGTGRGGTGNHYVVPRLTNNQMFTNGSGAETSGASNWNFQSNIGFTDNNPFAGFRDSLVDYGFARAPGFFDVVCYTGTGSYPQTVNHNLGAAPNLMIFKSRSATDNWYIYSSAVTSPNPLWYQNYGTLDVGTNFASDTTSFTTAPTTSAITVASYFGAASTNYIVYLFATLAGISKVGSYAGTGTLQTINCGFSSGARFVMIKRTNSTGDWYFWDSTRGISAANDPYMLFNTTAAEVTSTNYVDTDSTGFKVTAAASATINTSGGNYLFFAIA